MFFLRAMTTTELLASFTVMLLMQDIKKELESACLGNAADLF